MQRVVYVAPEASNRNNPFLRAARVVWLGLVWLSWQQAKVVVGAGLRACCMRHSMAHIRVSKSLESEAPAPCVPPDTHTLDTEALDEGYKPGRIQMHISTS